MPLEQIGNALTFEAFYTDSGSGALGLTVTADVWELTAGGVATELVSGDAATEIGDGLYYYQLAAGSVDAEAIYTAVFKTADACDQAHIAAGWVVGPTWVENVDATVGTRATQADILNDATPFAGADIDQSLSTTESNIRGVDSDDLTTISGQIDDVPEDIHLLDWTGIGGVVPSRCLLNALRFSRNKWRILGGVLTVYEEDDITVAWQGSVTTAVSDPVDSIDPA